MMKILLFLMISLVAFVGCESEYDKMSEYEKAIYDVGNNCTLSVEDILKSAPVWSGEKIISCTGPNGNGDINMSDYSNDDLDGGIRYCFEFGSRFRCWRYCYVGPANYMGYYLDCEYSIQADKSLNLNLESILADRPFIRNVRVVAYNESCVVIETYDGGTYYPYVTFVLKPATAEKKLWLENDCKGLTKIE